jgi:hypothetical protein
MKVKCVFLFNPTNMSNLTIGKIYDVLEIIGYGSETHYKIINDYGSIREYLTMLFETVD